MIHPQWTILDPTLHTLTFVRSRSALLTSTILALGSSALATGPGGTEECISEAHRLHAYVEKLNLVVYATGARSIDIIQAQIVSTTFFMLQAPTNTTSFSHDGVRRPRLESMNNGGCARQLFQGWLLKLDYISRVVMMKTPNWIPKGLSNYDGTTFGQGVS